MSEQETYLSLINWLRQNWLGLPEAYELMPLMKAAYTPEEASLLVGIPFSERYLEELAGLKQTAPDELRGKLDVLAKKGALFRTFKGDSVLYRLNDSEFMFYLTPFWPGCDDKRTKEMAPLANQYYYRGFWDIYKYTHHKIMRTLPIEGTIEDTRQILPFEDVVKVLDTKERFSVTTCSCRHRKNLDPGLPDCKHSTQNCLHFNQLATYTIENGMGREITREEAHEILRQAAEEGLVHGLSNRQEKAETICNCCKCCCETMEAYHKLGHAEGITPSNYRVRVDPILCIGCEQCIKRCPMEAIRLEDSPQAKNRVSKIIDKAGKVKELKNKTGEIAVINTESCIGCGVCAYKCSTKSLVLDRCEVITYPPKDSREYQQWVKADLEAARFRQDSSQ
ncbi:4Fe-4S binding protein [Chloroflexota bacterium]